MKLDHGRVIRAGGQERRPLWAFLLAEQELREFLGSAYTTPKQQPEIAVSERWNKENPKTQEEVLQFYRDCEEYLYEHTDYHARRSSQMLYWKIHDLLRELGVKQTFDHGCGIGSFSIELERDGFEVAAGEVSAPSLDFTRWRFKKRNSPAVVLDLLSDKIPTSYEAVLSIYVIEHHPDPENYVQQLAQLAERVLIIIGSPGEHDPARGGMPQHFDFRWSAIEKTLSHRGWNKIKAPIRFAYPPRVWVRGMDRIC